MHGTFMALGLLLTEAATLKSGKGIAKERPAFFAKRTPAMLLPAPQFNHMPYRLLLPINSSHTDL